MFFESQTKYLPWLYHKMRLLPYGFWVCHTSLYRGWWFGEGYSDPAMNYSKLCGSVWGRNLWFGAKSWIQTIYPREIQRGRYITGFPHMKSGMQKCALRAPLFPVVPPLFLAPRAPEYKCSYMPSTIGASLLLYFLSAIYLHIWQSEVKYKMCWD